MTEKHGTSSDYRRGCRCDLCKEAQSAAARAWRNKSREKDRERQKEWRRRNPDKVREHNERIGAEVSHRNRIFREENPDDRTLRERLREGYRMMGDYE